MYTYIGHYLLCSNTAAVVSRLVDVALVKYDVNQFGGKGFESKKERRKERERMKKLSTKG